ncbi:MAG: hypothetical protein OXL37_01555 [Chloroflexota bacterium]|nr:hypothetical protein [Chloroflexota bacterium]MDE2961290.1 hypothetical protein [Chloroflexota bacterium]
MTTAESSRLRLVNPKGTELPQSEFRMNDRSAGLAGKRLGLMENSKANAGALLMELGNILNERHGFSEIKFYDKGHASLPAPQQTIDSILGEVDYLITGVGD